MLNSFKKKFKKFVISFDLTLRLSLNCLPSQSVGVFLPHKPAELKTFSYDQSNKFEVCKIIQNENELNFSEDEKMDLYEIYIQLIDNLAGRKEFANQIMNFRGGDFREIADALVSLGIIVLLIKNQPVNSFNLNGNGIRPAPSSLEIGKPSSMPHEKFVGLSKQDRRSLCHKKDIKMILEDCQELTVGFYQSKYKLPKHGHLHGIDYVIKPNGTFKSTKTDQNALKLMYSVANMPYRNNVKLFKNAIYQPGTKRQFAAIFIYDLDENIIAVFKKSNGRFVTTCKLNPVEREELLKNGTFGGKKTTETGETKNLTSKKIDGTENGSSNLMNKNTDFGFTPLNSFENDILGISPIDQSQSDDQ